MSFVIKPVLSAVRKAVLHPIYGDEGPRWLKRYFRNCNGVSDHYKLTTDIAVGSTVTLTVMPALGNGNFGLPVDCPALVDNKIQTVSFTTTEVISTLGKYGSNYFEGVIVGITATKTGETPQNIKFDNPNSVYQRNRAVAQGVELYSDSFALPEFFSRDGNIITKTGTTSGTIFIANVEAGKHYRLSFRKDSHSEGTPNLRDQLSNQYIFPLMSPLESSGKTYEFVFTATTDGQVGINGTASLWSVSELSIKEFHGGEVVGGMPEDWFQVERQPHWDYWREVGNESNVLEIAQ